MNALFGGISDIIIGYFGGLEFIDKQPEFNNTFGSDSIILSTNPAMADTTTTAKLLLEFSDQCCLDVYLNACRKFYVGSMSVNTRTIMIEVCGEILKLRLEWKDTNGQVVVDTPEELFTKFLALGGVCQIVPKGG